MCYGKSLWTMQLQGLGWTSSLINAVEKSEIDQPRGSVISQCVWQYELEDIVSEFRLCVWLPAEVNLDMVRVDLGIDQVVVSVLGGSSESPLEGLNLALSVQLDPTKAQPVRHNRRARSL